jgi:hypothetical protein
MALAAVSGALLSAANGISARIHAIADALPGGGEEQAGADDDVREGELRIPMDRFKLLERLRRGHPKKYAALLQLARAQSAPSVLREPSEVVRQRVANALS